MASGHLRLYIVLLVLLKLNIKAYIEVELTKDSTYKIGNHALD